MSVFKRIGGGGHVVEPFEANASQSFQWTSGSTGIDGFSVNLAKAPPAFYPGGSGDLGGVTDGGFNSYPLYQSIKSFFYINSDMGDAFGFYPSDNVFVVNAGSNYTGDSIVPGTFKFAIDGVSDFIQDDVEGHLRLNRTGSIVGNAFYSHGICVMKQDTGSVADSITTDGVGIFNATATTTTFMSRVTIYEHTVACRISPADYRTTINPTSFITGSDTKSYNDHANEDSVLPYITTVGLFSDFNELLAVAKLSKPITRQKFTDQTFIIKFDE